MIKTALTHTGGGSARRERDARYRIHKVVEVVGTSEESISKAIEGAVTKASASLRHLGRFEVSQIPGNIEDGKVKK